MLEQATINGRAEDQAESRPVGTASHALHDLVLLAELQAKLLALDLQQGTQRIVRHALLLLGGLVVVLSALPVAIVALAHTLAHFSTLSLLAAYWITLAAVSLVALVVISVAVSQLRRVTNIFARSEAEWRYNIGWIKETLRRPRTPPAV